MLASVIADHVNAFWNGLDGRKFSASPLRDHPPAEISLVDFLGRKRTPGILSRQLVLLEVRAELSDGNGLEG